jgi:hypothetical protein
MTDKALLEKLEMLEELAINQDKALKTADQLLNLKTKLVELCEEEVEIYKKQSKKLAAISIISFAFSSIVILVNLVYLIIK